MPTKKQSPTHAVSGPDDARNWMSPAGRVAYLVETLCEGNRSRFAELIGVSHTAVNKVIAGQPPGRKMLAAIARHVSVSAEWLLSGAGEPALAVTSGSRAAGVAVARKPLAGPPAQHAADIVGMEWPKEWDQLFSSSQYWLVLVGDQPILREKWRGFKAGDRLLMETDRAKFPAQKDLYNRLAIVRFSDLAAPLKLCLVEYEPASEEHGPACLVADTFEGDEDDLYEDVYQHLKDGIRYVRRKLRQIDFRGAPLIVDADAGGQVGESVQIRYADIVAVWLQIMHRPRSVPI